MLDCLDFPSFITHALHGEKPLDVFLMQSLSLSQGMSGLTRMQLAALVASFHLHRPSDVGNRRTPCLWHLVTRCFSKLVKVTPVDHLDRGKCNLHQLKSTYKTYSCFMRFHDWIFKSNIIQLPAGPIGTSITYHPNQEPSNSRLFSSNIW